MGTMALPVLMNHKQQAKEEIMKRFTLFGIVTLIAMAMLCGPALAGPTMDKIEKTGILKMGFREGSIPFAFVDPKVGKHVGFR